jgi:hypothetical protein
MQLNKVFTVVGCHAGGEVGNEPDRCVTGRRSLGLRG